MATVVNDPYFFERLLILSQCVCEEIEKAGLKKPAFCGVIPGEIAIADYCNCDSQQAGGQAWVRLAGILPYQSSDFDQQNLRCMPPMEAQVEVGIMRCAPTLDVNGNPPTQEQQLESVRQLTADMAALLRAISCDCTGFPRGDIRIINWLPISEQGGCLGGVWNIAMDQSYGG